MFDNKLKNFKKNYNPRKNKVGNKSEYISIPVLCFII